MNTVPSDHNCTTQLPHVYCRQLSTRILQIIYCRTRAVLVARAGTEREAHLLRLLLDNMPASLDIVVAGQFNVLQWGGAPGL